MAAFRRPDRVAWSLVVMAIGFRLALFGFCAGDPDRSLLDSDSAEYLRIARNLAEGHGFTQSEGPPYTPDVRRTPVYPTIVAAVSAMPHAGVRAAVIAGILAAAATVIVQIELTRILFGPVAARAAGLLLGLDLTSAAYATQLLTEMVFTLLLTGSLLALVDARRSTGPRAVAAGTLAGLAALCRPIALLFPVVLLPACVWPESGGRSRKTSTIHAAVRFVIVVAISTVLVSIWAFRNQRVSGATTISSVAATNIYLHRAAYVAARQEHRRVEDVRAEWERELSERSAGWTTEERLDWMQQHGCALILANPLDYVVVFGQGLLRMLRPDADILPRVLGISTASRAWAVIVTVAWIQLLVVYALAAYGTAIVWRRSRLLAAVPIAVLAYFVLVGGPEMYPRFRVPLMPVICMLAGAAMYSLVVPPTGQPLAAHG
jgi:4-amino-4-deoxy-L-arabinose transferase-like glycosyltransferase